MLRSKGLAGNEVDFETKWTAIEKAFREIHTQNASGLSYEELYRDAYQVVLKKKGEELYTRVSRFEHEWLSGEVRASILAHISPQILTTLGVATPNERRVAGERFLKGLKEAWGHHQVCMSMISDVLMYMVRTIKVVSRVRSM
jgi:cullin 3